MKNPCAIAVGKLGTLPWAGGSSPPRALACASPTAFATISDSSRRAEGAFEDPSPKNLSAADREDVVSGAEPTSSGQTNASRPTASLKENEASSISRSESGSAAAEWMSSLSDPVEAGGGGAES